MLQSLLGSPLKVFAICWVFALSSFLMKGNWINLYRLSRDRAELGQQISQLQTSLEKLNLEMKRAKDPAFIEKQALDQLDMASEEDLVFVFSE